MELFCIHCHSLELENAEEFAPFSDTPLREKDRPWRSHNNHKAQSQHQQTQNQQQ
jgi:hypothetical protein